MRFLRLSEADSPGECSSHLHPHQSEVSNIKPQRYISRIESGLSEVNQYIKHGFSEFLNQIENVKTFQPTSMALIASPAPPGGFGALQARLYQPISGSGEEDGAESDEAQSFERNQAGLSTRIPGENVQTKEEVHNTRSTQW